MSYIAITGASAGIGAAAAIELTRQGHSILAIGRSAAKLRDVRRRMAEAAPADTFIPTPIQCDLAELEQTRTLADDIREIFPKLDVLVNNAGVQPPTRRLSGDGYELTLAVNHLAPFLLTNLLVEHLRGSNGRVVTTASSNHATGTLDFSDIHMERSFDSRAAYDRSKLANVLFTGEFVRRTGLPAASFHPGTISTDLNRDERLARLLKPVERIVMGTPEKGADTLQWLATSPEGAEPSAVYYYKRRPAPVAAAGRDPQLAGRLWEVSEELVALP